MKQYSKPILFFVELRTEERIAACTLPGECGIKTKIEDATPEVLAMGYFYVS